jgi:hypothetical protein
MLMMKADSGMERISESPTYKSVLKPRGNASVMQMHNTVPMADSLIKLVSYIHIEAACTEVIQE